MRQRFTVGAGMEAGEGQLRRTGRFAALLRRLGWIGILFFTIKGVIWLLVLWGAGTLIGR